MREELELKMISSSSGFDRMVRTCFLLLGSAGGIMGVARVLRGEMSMALPGLAVFFVAVLSFLLIKKTKTIMRALYLLCFVFIMGQVYHLFTAGLYSPSVMWFVAMPVLTLVLPLGQGIRMSIAFIGVLSFFYWGPSMGWIPQPQPDLSESQLAFRYVIAVIAILASLVATHVLRSGYKKVYSELQDREKKLTESRAQLLRSESRLQQLLKERDSLLRMLTHDLATPTMSIDLSVSLLEKKGSLDLKALDRIKLATRNIKQLSVHVRELTALESGKLNLDEVQTDLRQRLMDLQELLQPAFQEKGVYLRSNLPEGPIWIHAEEIHIKNIMMNLLSNSLKFSHPGSVIQLSCFCDQDKVSISVRDQGVGIPKALMAEIFSFHKKTTRLGTHGEKGTGFGLPLVANYVQALGGTVQVQSKSQEEHPNDHGTEFCVTLPRVQVSKVSNPKAA